MKCQMQLKWSAYANFDSRHNSTTADLITDPATVGSVAPIYRRRLLISDAEVYRYSPLLP